MSAVEASEDLHARVRRFARAALAAPPGRVAFDALAADIARYQVAHVPGFRRLVEASGSSLRDAASIPAVPVDAFRLARVAVHPPEQDEVRFVTSGTTSAAQGVHVMRTTRTYRELSLAWGIPMLTRGVRGPFVAVALAPDPGDARASSLGFMMLAFMQTLDGRSLADGASGAFDTDARARWLAGPSGVDVEGLARAARLATARGEPLLVLSTGFALALLVEAFHGTLRAPEGSVVMTTGGFKGKVRDVDAHVLVRAVAATLGVPEDRVVGEYGMTELTSQLYERPPSEGGALGVFYPPPWLEVTPVDAETLEPVPAEEPGLARFVDLGNVDSAVAIVTQDRVRRAGAGIALLGRAPGAPPRGCSLALREMVLDRGER